MCLFFFFFNDTATTEIYTLSLHDALPISRGFRRVGAPKNSVLILAWRGGRAAALFFADDLSVGLELDGDGDRKSTRLNSSHSQISYAVFCLKKKKKNKQ